MASEPNNADYGGVPTCPGVFKEARSAANPSAIVRSVSVDLPVWFATACIFFSAGVGTGGWVASIPRICRDFALSTSALGAGLPAVAGGSLIATVFGPFVVKRMGAARASIVCGSLFMFSIIGPTLVGGFPTLIWPFVALGITCGATEICMNAYASAIEQTKRRPLMSSFHASQTLGMLVGVALGGAIAGLGGSTTMGSTGAASLMGTALTIATVIMMRRNQFRGAPAACRTDKRERGQSPSSSLFSPPPPPPPSPPKLPMWPRRCFRTLSSLSLAAPVLGVTLGIAALMQNGVADWGGVYCVTVLGLSDALSGSGFSCLLVAIVFSRVIGDGLVGRVGPIMIIRAGALLVAAGYLTVWLAPSMLFACLGFIIVGLGLGNLNPILLSLLGRVSGHPAKAISVAMGVNYVCAMSGPLLIGFMAECYGLRQAFLGLAVAAVLVATVLVTVIKRTGVARSGP